jgi:hypothetical protein
MTIAHRNQGSRNRGLQRVLRRAAVVSEAEGEG